MRAHAYDSAYGVLLEIFSGPTNSDQDFEEYLAHIDELAKRAVESGVDRPVCVVVVDPGNPRPDARNRQRIADRTKSFQGRPIFALVSDSALLRGVVTAINWLRPPPYDFSVHETFDQAVAWVEEKRGNRLPILNALYRDARNELARLGSPMARRA